MNYSRNDLINAEATFNQMRNAIYHLARFMVKNNVSDVQERLRRMGRNIGRTFINYWKPTDLVSTSNVKDVITTIYKKIVNSTVSIEINKEDKIFIVRDYKCPLCKYKYEDINISGCEILISLVAEFINLINKESNDPLALFLEPLRVKESKAYGHNVCMLEFRYKLGG